MNTNRKNDNLSKDTDCLLAKIKKNKHNNVPAIKAYHFDSTSDSTKISTHKNIVEKNNNATIRQVVDK